MPRTNFHRIPNNSMEKMLWGRVPIEKATSYFYYSKGGNYNKLVHQLKYKGNKELGKAMGACMANEIKDSGFFNTVDFIVPVPLHPRKQRKRGYNQSEWIAQGIAQITGIPCETNLLTRTKYTDTQTRKSAHNRMESMDEVFKSAALLQCEGKHILLVDDILTTGSTIVACSDALNESQNIRISVLTLGVAT